MGILLKDWVMHQCDIHVFDSSFEGILWLQLTNKQTQYKLCVCVCYLPPSNSSRGDISHDFFDSLKTMVYKYHCEGDFFICGDFNARCGNTQDIWDSSAVIPRRLTIDHSSNIAGKLLLDFLESADMCMLNGRFGDPSNRYTSFSPLGMSLVDYCLVPIELFNNFSQFSVHPTPELVDQLKIQVGSTLPDHSILTWNLSLKNQPTPHDPKLPSYVTLLTEDYFKTAVAKEKLENLCDSVKHLPPNQFALDSVYNQFCILVDSQLLHKPAHHGPKKHSHKPWWGPELSQLRKDLRKAFHSWSSDRKNLSKLNSYRQTQKKFDGAVRYAKRIHKAKEHQELLFKCKKNPKAFWKYFNNLGVRAKSKLPDSVIDSSGKKVKQPEDVVECWGEYFKTLFLEEPSAAGQSPSQSDILLTHQNPVDASELNVDISYEEVKAAVLSAENNKAAGADSLKPAFLKQDDCIQFLHQLFQFCFKHSITPTPWSKGIIQPIPKGSNGSQNPQDYRGICLQSVVLKAYSKILNQRLNCWLEDNNLLADEQNGFRKSRCTQDHLFALASVVESRKSSGKSTFAAFIDLRKAFDSVIRGYLWQKVEGLGVHGSFLGALKAMYSSVLSSVRVNDKLSEWFSVDKGVKQGCLLSPALFSIYINDLILEINGLGIGIQCDSRMISTLVYADDIILLAEKELDLQKLLDVVQTWCSKWGISINTQKSNVIHFRKKGKRFPRTDFNFLVGAEPITLTHTYKYLGFWVNEHWDMVESVNHVITNANRSLSRLISKSRSAGGFPYSAFTKLFQSLVVTVVDYSAGLWGFKFHSKIQVIQNRAMRFFLNVNMNVPIAALQGEMGWVPMRVHIRLAVLRLWHRLCTLPDGRLTGDIFRWSCNLADSGVHNWAADARDLLKETQFNPDLMLFNRKDFLDSAWNALTDSELQEWKRFLWTFPRGSETTGRLRLYREIKPLPMAEAFVTGPIPADWRRVMAALRMGCLPLEVETGRFGCAARPLQQRVCKLCSTDVENEEHFLLHCHALKEERKDLFNAMCKTEGNKFLCLNATTKVLLILKLAQQPRQICKLVFSMYSKRRSLLLK